MLVGIKSGTVVGINYGLRAGENFSMRDWKTINSTAGLYEANADGLIRHSAFLTRRSQRVLIAVPNRAGYLRVCLWVNGKRLNRSVHRLVAEAYHGFSELQVNHKDGVKENNSACKVKFNVVIDGSPENKEFFRWTPSGQIDLGTVNRKAWEQFPLGREVYVDFTDATAPGSA